MMTKYFNSADDYSNQRLTKPMIEKRRRARINQCLLQLKEIVIDSGKQRIQNPKCKYEKADILELTVAYLQRLHLNDLPPQTPPLSPTSPVSTTSTTPILSSVSSVSSPSNPSSSTSSSASVIISKYEQSYAQGFTDCAKQVEKFLLNNLSSNDSIGSSFNRDSFGQNLMEHLEGVLHQYLITRSLYEQPSDQHDDQQMDEVKEQKPRVIRHTSDCDILSPSHRSSPSVSSVSSVHSLSHRSSPSVSSPHRSSPLMSSIPSSKICGISPFATSVSSPFASEFVSREAVCRTEEDTPLNLTVYGNERNGYMDIDCVWRPW